VRPGDVIEAAAAGFGLDFDRRVALERVAGLARPRVASSAWIGCFVAGALAAGCGARTPIETDGDSEGQPPGGAGTPGACEVRVPGTASGALDCPGCPVLEGAAALSFEQTTDNSVFDIRSAELGFVRGNDGPGRWRIEGNAGQLNEGAVVTDAGGSYDTKAPLFCGPQTLDLGFCNDAGTAGYRFSIERQSCLEGGLHVTLSWGAGASDLELHLVREGAHINDPIDDCTWTTCVSSSPNWGDPADTTDDPHKDIDWLSDNGVENIELAKLEPIRYGVLVEYWGTGGPIAADIVVNAFGAVTQATSPTMSPQTVWVVGTIDARTQLVALQEGALVDCASAWESGCRLPIP